MAKIFRVYAANGRDRYAELDLPAGDYEMLDLMERLRLKPGQLPYLELLECREEHGYLEKCIHELPDIFQLNALAKKLAELTSPQDMAAFEGLVGKEIGNRAVTIELPRLIDFAYSTDCCHVAEDAMTDFQLGKFLVENDFIEEANNLPDSMLALLDYGKIGREHREQEGGVYTGFGYLEQHTDVRHVSETMDYRPHKPAYTILLNVLPVVLLLLVLWFATGQAWLSCMITGALLFLLTGAMLAGYFGGLTEPFATGVILFTAFIYLAVAAGVIVALFQRWKEIQGGEEDAAKKY